MHGLHDREAPGMRRRLGTARLLSACALLTSAVTASAQPADPLPALDLGQERKGVAVSLDFTGATAASLRSVEVFFGRAHGRGSAPPMLSIDLLDLSGNSVSRFNAWHPLWAFAKDDAGHDRTVVRSRATGHFVFPFAPALATMRVLDGASLAEIVSVDLVTPFHGFCRNHRADPDCGQVANRPPVCDAGGPYRVECTGPTTAVGLDGRRSNDPDADPLQWAWNGPFQGLTATGPTPGVRFSGIGHFGVGLAVRDDFGGSSACGATVDVIDTAPPVLQAVSASPSVLWPPSHELVAVQVKVDSDDTCFGGAACHITEVTSNEPPNGAGDGSTTPDWVITAPLTLQLRAERSGTGHGRTYRVAISCQDAAGNLTAGEAQVTVPHDQAP